jgi:hypothetical protein
MHGQTHERAQDRGNGGEVLLRIVTGVRIQRCGDRQRYVGHLQRVPVGRGLRHGARPERRRRAGAVLDDDLPAESLREKRRHDARGDVGRSARSIGHDERDVAAGIVRGVLRRLHRAWTTSKQALPALRARVPYRAFRHLPICRNRSGDEARGQARSRQAGRARGILSITASSLTLHISANTSMKPAIRAWPFSSPGRSEKLDPQQASSSGWQISSQPDAQPRQLSNC